MVLQRNTCFASASSGIVPTSYILPLAPELDLKAVDHCATEKSRDISAWTSTSTCLDVNGTSAVEAAQKGL